MSKQLLDDMGVGLLRSLQREISEIAVAGAEACQLPPTTFERWAEDIAIALHLEAPTLKKADHDR